MIILYFSARTSSVAIEKNEEHAAANCYTYSTLGARDAIVTLADVFKRSQVSSVHELCDLHLELLAMYCEEPKNPMPLRSEPERT